MSLADRQRSQTSSALGREDSKTGAGGGGVWDGLDLLGSGASSSSKLTTGEDDDDWGFGLTKPTSATGAKSTSSSTGRAIDEPQPIKASSSSSSTADDLFDFLSSSSSSAPPPPHPSSSRQKPTNPSPSSLAPERNDSPTFDPFEKFNSAPSLTSTTIASTTTRSKDDGAFNGNDNDDNDGPGDREDREDGFSGGGAGRDYGDDDGDDEILGILGNGGKVSSRRRVIDDNNDEVRIPILSFHSIQHD